MSRPPRVTDTRTGADHPRTFFVTSRTAGGRALFQADRMSMLLIDVLRGYAQAGKFTIHDFVVMPNHLHVQMTIQGDLRIEKAVQFIKGSFSFRAKRELGFPGGIWQVGFSEVGVRDRANFLEHRRYIEQNPVKAGLVELAEDYPYCSLFFKRQRRAAVEGEERDTEFAQGLKPHE